MKNTNDSNSTTNQSTTQTLPSVKIKGITSVTGHSLRPQRSMVRVQSLKPKNFLNTVKKKSIK